VPFVCIIVTRTCVGFNVLLYGQESMSDYSSGYWHDIPSSRCLLHISQCLLATTAPACDKTAALVFVCVKHAPL
jgi:hypothetical protein